MDQTNEEREAASNALNTSRPPSLKANKASFLERVFGIKSAAGKIGCMSPLLIPIVLLGYCSYQSIEANRAVLRTEAAQRAANEAAASVVLDSKQTEMVCKAGIAILMGRDPKTMTTTRQPDGLTRVQYRRPDDNKLWKTDCRIDGNRFLWRGVDSFGNDGPGRWRDGPDDEVITFTIDGKTVAMNERYSDGSTTSETYRF